MAKITAIQPQKYDPNRVSIHLDGEYAFGLAKIVAAWLTVGEELSEEKVSSLKAEDSCEHAYQQALLFLSYRPRSESEIRQNLRKHDIPEQFIEQTLERLREDRLADDKQFARSWVENRSTFRPRGRRALTMELRQKGIADDVVGFALADLDEEALAYKAGLKKARHLQVQEWDEFRRKLADFLARRGFPYSVITPVVSRLWDEAHTEEHILNNEETP